MAGAGLVVGAGFVLVVALDATDRTQLRALSRQKPWMPTTLADFCIGAVLRLNARQVRA